jgi:hypothetical protein
MKEIQMSNPTSLEELPDANSLSEEEFDKVFEQLSSIPEETPEESSEAPEENNGILTPEEVDSSAEEPQNEPEELPEDEDEDTEEVEQPKDSAEDEEQDLDEDVATEDSEENTEDSTQEEPSKSKSFNFEELPMDELLPMEIPANGTKVKATMNELIEGFKKGMNYTQKMQELAPLRRSLSIVSSNDISEEDLNLLVEAKQGSKEALAKLMSNSGVDPLDVEVEEHSNYKPADYGKDEVDMEMDIVRKEILADTEYSEQVKEAVTSMPEDMYTKISSSANNLKALHQDIRAGIYQEVMPEVVKLQALYGKTEPTMDTYVKVANKLFNEKSAAQKQETVKKAVKDTTRANNRKRVAPTSKSPKKDSYIKQDIKSMDDDEFAAEFQKIMGRSIDAYK